MLEENPTYFFWDMIRRLEIMILTFERSHRETNFRLYIEILEKLVPLFFALNHTNYARWASVYLQDLWHLPESVSEAFEHKHWVISKSKRKFSAIAIDEAHEQMNRILKASGGVIGLFQNTDQLQRWMVSGPEVAMIMDEFHSLCSDESTVIRD